MLADVRQAQRLGILDQHAEHAAPARQIADSAVRIRVDAGGEELRELRAAVVEDPQRGVPRARQLAGGLQHAVEQDTQVELGDERAADLQETPDPELVWGFTHQRRA